MGVGAAPEKFDISVRCGDERGKRGREFLDFERNDLYPVWRESGKRLQNTESYKLGFEEGKPVNRYHRR